MISDRQRFEVENADGSTHIRLVFKSQECAKGSERAREVVAQVWSMFNSNPNLYYMPPLVTFENLTVRHDGQQWIFTFSGTHRG